MYHHELTKLYTKSCVEKAYLFLIGLKILISFYCTVKIFKSAYLFMTEFVFILKY